MGACVDRIGLQLYDAAMAWLESNLIRKLLIIFGFFMTALFAFGHFIDGDVIQILDKAHLLVTQGTVIPYGNATASGASGSLPGSFLTLITGLPMLVWPTPWAALVVLAGLHFLSLLMFQDILKHFVSTKVLMVLIVLFWLNPWRLSEVFLWNPGYMFFVTLLHMWSAYHLSKRASFVFSIIHGLSLFLGLQVHPSFFILFFITMMLLWMKALKPHLLGTISGIIIGLGTLVPYFLAGLEDPSLFPQPGSSDGKGFLFFGLLYVYPLLKGFWYWILFGSNIFQTHIFHQINFSWIGVDSLELITKYLWTIVKYGIGAVGVIVSFRVNFHFYKTHKSKFNILKYKMKNKNEWLVIYTITAFAATLMATAIAPTLPIYWHLLYVWPMTLIPLLLKFNELFENKEWAHKASRYLMVLIIYFSATNILAALGSKKHDIYTPLQELYLKACTERCSMKQLEERM